LEPDQKCSTLFEAVAKIVDLHDIRTIFLISRWSLYAKNKTKIPAAGQLRFADDLDSSSDREHVFSASLTDTFKKFHGRQIDIEKEPPSQSVYVTDAMAQNAFMGFKRLESRWTKLPVHLTRNRFVNSAIAACVNEISPLSIQPTQCAMVICALHFVMGCRSTGMMIILTTVERRSF
jgi:hypothetical protein